MLLTMKGYIIRAQRCIQLSAQLHNFGLGNGEMYLGVKKLMILLRGKYDLSVIAVLYH